jgi:hypothetical protein
LNSVIKWGIRIKIDVAVYPTFRSRYHIPEDSFLILTIGSLTGAKGHLELGQAVFLIPKNGHDITLLLNGNDPFPKALSVEDSSAPPPPSV